MSVRDELAEAVKAVTQHRAVFPPADEKTIAQVEQRFGIQLPADMFRFYCSMDGMAYPTEPDNGWIRLWSLDSWRLVRDEPIVSSKYGELGHAILFADHCDVSWWYAADFATQTGPKVHLIDGLRSAKLVASTFTAFVKAALADSAEIYPDAETAG